MHTDYGVGQSREVEKELVSPLVNLTLERIII
jgi:hypothetical protein